MNEDIITNLKSLKLDLVQLPYERFYDIWKYLNITSHTDIIKIKKEVPELTQHINSAVTVIDFQRDHYNNILGCINKDNIVTDLNQVYPHIKHADNLLLGVNDKTIDQIRSQKYFRNVEIYTETNGKPDIYYDLIIDIIARNKGDVKVSIRIIIDSGKHTDSIYHSVSYNCGEVEVGDKYLIEKIIEIRPERLVFNLPETNIVDMLRLASIQTVHSLHFSFFINNDSNDTSIYIYRILVALLYINNNMSDDYIKDIYNTHAGFNSDYQSDKLNKRHIKSITYDYESNKCVVDSDYYDYLLTSTINSDYVHGTSHIFPEVEVMTLPINIIDYHNWCRVLPNVTNFISDDTFMASVIEKRNQQLLNSVAINNNLINNIKANLASGLRSHQEKIPLL